MQENDNKDILEKWNNAQVWEKDWHDNCVNSLNEELKQLVYAEKMGLKLTPNAKTPYNIELNRKSILDIGSGPYSLILKCNNYNRFRTYVVDPLMSEYPRFVRTRYKELNINTITSSGESILEQISEDFIFDEVWLYNVLQHTYDPELIIKNARKLGKIIRIFEWINTSVNVGHLHTLTEDNLNKWLGGYGKVERLNERGCYGDCYYGIFKGDNYVASSTL